MTTYSINGASYSNPSQLDNYNQMFTVAYGAGGDTVISSISNVGIVYENGVVDAAILSGTGDTIQAGGNSTGTVAGSSLVLFGSFNLIEGSGSDNGLSLAGSNNTIVAGDARSSQDNVSIAGNFNTLDLGSVSNSTVTVSGQYNSVSLGAGGQVTISGYNDTVSVQNASTIVITGYNDVVEEETSAGVTLPNPIGADSTTPQVIVSVTGANNIVTLGDVNAVVMVTGDDDSIAAGDLSTIVASGNGDSLSASAIQSFISVSGANNTVTSILNARDSAVSAQYGFGQGSITFTGAGSVGAVVQQIDPQAPPPDDASPPTNLDIGPGGGFGYSLQVWTYAEVTDASGGNVMSVNGASALYVSAGNDTVQFLPNIDLTSVSLDGSLGANTLNFSTGDYYFGATTDFVSSDNVLNLNGTDEAVLFAANQDTVNLRGANNSVILEQNNQLPDAAAASLTGGASVINVDGASTALIETAGNSISGADGAGLTACAGDNTITGQDLTAQVSGTGNVLILSGADTVMSASPYSYQSSSSAPMTVQNQMTVQSGQFTLGGLDALDQVSGTAAISLFGGNAVTLNGTGDSVTAADQIYGGNAIENDGVGNTIAMVNTANAAATITANASTLVSEADNTGTIIGGGNDNSNEHLTFIAGTGTANTIFGAGSNMAITLFGGQSTGNVVYGGQAGNNSLNGGTGGADAFTGGGNNDVLIGGAEGANTLIAGAGAETLVGAGLGNDAFSITGGGTDLIQNFSGSLTINAGLSITNETTTGGALVVTLNDQTQITFAGLTQVNQAGNVFSSV